MPLPLTRELPPLKGQRVTVLGLGLFGGGLGVTRFLVRQGATVTVTDAKSEAELRESVDQLRPLPVTLRLGGHDERDFRDADLVIVNPAVPETHPYLRMARTLETEMNLFFKLCPAKTVLGVTGSNGKTTTTLLIGEILKKHPKRTWVGGNIGVSLLEFLPEIDPDHLVVLELSSFQLENLGAIRRSPTIGAVLNLSPNHLDRHGTMDAYVAAKRQIVTHPECDTKILNWDDPITRGFRDASPAETFYFSLKEQPSSGAWAHEDRIDVVVPDGIGRVDVSGRKIPGWFNLANMAAAATATCPSSVPGWDWNAWQGACQDALNAFPGVEHRLEFVVEKNGVKYYNDSKATDAEATIAALETLPGPFVLILGGFDKKTPWDAFARAVAARPVRAAVLLGQTAPAIEAALRSSPRPPQIVRVATLEDAVRVPAKPGETVLLSPACASWDMFRNFTERGLLFKALVAALPAG
ncbi:MAG TPA: UDP-N-acetylmuramoyl-L-alanine--D-glutamate ligase [Planctomycetota bacterium]|nr:UDP-N-acetylmuramoyl-L-alanine--D-glutamate ligase [Planctomycetota bacterium]